MSRNATTEAVASSSRVLAPSKTAPRSASIAAGPVTCAVTPGRDLVAQLAAQALDGCGDLGVGGAGHRKHAERSGPVRADLQGRLPDSASASRCVASGVKVPESAV